MIKKIYRFPRFLRKILKGVPKRNGRVRGSFLGGLTPILLLLGDVDINTLKTVPAPDNSESPPSFPPAVIRTTTPPNSLMRVAQPPKTISHLRTLFSHLKSPGVIAICAAEGNCQVNGAYTRLIHGHLDPATRRLNQGFCSNHGRGGTLSQANQWCLRRLRQQLVEMEETFLKLGMVPEQDVEGLINGVDLWNQSPKRGMRFPSLYASALEKGLSDMEAILWARVETFRDGAGYAQNNLAKPPICGSRQSAKFCVTRDQKRRVNAISSVLQSAQ